ncbi:MAG TPA: tetratricopeptide repeat protein [Thermotogota bacterium]|nr:tetratricopeptide repeat protein [Thermotogota bacterium]HRW92093.1 tetratricopeptide repeat protein [Thermotogota bacterium]
MKRTLAYFTLFFCFSWLLTAATVSPSSLDFQRQLEKLAIHPESLVENFNTGQGQYHRGEYEESYHRFVSSQTLRDDSKNEMDRVLVALGDSYYQLGMLEHALDAYKRALRLNPLNETAMEHAEHTAERLLRHLGAEESPDGEKENPDEQSEEQNPDSEEQDPSEESEPGQGQNGQGDGKSGKEKGNGEQQDPDPQSSGEQDDPDPQGMPEGNGENPQSTGQNTGSDSQQPGPDTSQPGNLPGDASEGNGQNTPDAPPRQNPSPAPSGNLERLFRSLQPSDVDQLTSNTQDGEDGYEKTILP